MSISKVTVKTPGFDDNQTSMRKMPHRHFDKALLSSTLERQSSHVNFVFMQTKYLYSDDP